VKRDLHRQDCDLAPQRGPDLILTDAICCPDWLGQKMQFDRVKRREFITLVGGAAAARPLAASAQQPAERLRRVGILMPYPENEPDIQARVRAFKQELQRLGWGEGSKIEFDERWATDNMESLRSNAASLLLFGWTGLPQDSSQPASFRQC
jgi:hypothetical protein